MRKTKSIRNILRAVKSGNRFLKSFLILIFCGIFCCLSASSQETKQSREQFPNLSAKDCSYEFIEKNDSTIELRVSINGHSGKAEYFRLKNENEATLPKFQGRYKDCLVFIHGYGQHYRLLTVFQVIKGKIVRDDYEHSMCMEPYKKEAYLFFYDSKPIKMTYQYKNGKVKFRKLRNRKKYNSYKGEVISSCKNRISIFKTDQQQTIGQSPSTL